MKKTDIFWLVSILLGFLFAFGVIADPNGLGIFLFMNVLLGSVIYFGSKNIVAKELEHTKESTYLLGIITAFYSLISISYLYRLDMEITALSLVTQLLLLFFGSWYFSLPSALHIVDIFMIIFSPIVAGITWVIETFNAVLDLFKENVNVVKLLLKVVFYAAMSLFVFMTFARFLSDADPEFKKRIDEIIELFQLSEIMGRTVLGVILTFASAGFLSIIGYTKALPLFGTNVEKAKAKWTQAFQTVFARKSDALLPVIVTAPVLFLFGLYVWVQFTYLFGQDVASVLERYTFAEYAHRGFAELLAVGILTYPIVSWSTNQAKTEAKIPRFVAFAINTGIVGLLVTMLYSLFVRMNIYMDSYGPSLLRMYVLIGATFVGIALLAYELLAIFKTVVPGYRVFKGRFFGDYTIVALVAGLGLLSILALVPWNRVVLTQIEAYYKETKKVDVFQIIELSDEAGPDVLAFAKTLERDAIHDGAALLRAHVATKRIAYDNSRRSSIFTQVFGFNFAGQRLLSSISDKDAKEQISSFTSSLTARVDDIVATYYGALEHNTFEAAREVFDPHMKANNISGFNQYVTVSRDYANIPEPIIDTYQRNEFLYGTSRYIVITDRLMVRRAYEQAASNKKVTTSSTDSYTSTVSIGFRNGTMYAVDSTLVLMYLPDAVSTKGKNEPSDLTMYGYSTYCKVPTLSVLFSESVGCTFTDTDENRENSEFRNGTTYSPITRLGGFYESDFVTAD